MSYAGQEDPIISAAISFLRNPKVCNATEKQKIAFLKSKGLTNEQICRAFKEVGVNVDLSTCESVPGPNKEYSSGSADASSGAAVYSKRSTHTLFPENYSPTNSSTQESTMFDWRNVVIGAGAAVLAAGSAVKLWNNYSPYEIKRKNAVAVPVSSPSPAPFVPAPSIPEPVAPRALPPLPTLPPQMPPPATSLKLEELTKEIETLKEALETERRSKAEITIRVSKLRGENYKLTYANQQLEQKVEEAEKEVQRLEKMQEAKKSEEVLSSESPAEEPETQSENNKDLLSSDSADGVSSDEPAVLRKEVVVPPGVDNPPFPSAVEVDVNEEKVESSQGTVPPSNDIIPPLPPVVVTIGDETHEV